MTHARAIFDDIIAPAFELSRAQWLAQARSAAWKLGQSGCTVTVNDVRAVCPPPANADPRVMGAVFTKSVWERVAIVNSDRGACHGRPIAAFRLRGSVG
jgi:hypothetical protein